MRLWEKVPSRRKPEIKCGWVFFTAGPVFTCTRWAGRLFWQIKSAGVRGQSRHTGMIDGSEWMLKSTEREHVSAALPGPSTQHLFKGQVLQNTLTVQPLPLSYQSLRQAKRKGKSALRLQNMTHMILGKSVDVLVTVQNEQMYLPPILWINSSTMWIHFYFFKAVTLFWSASAFSHFLQKKSLLKLTWMDKVLL